MFDEENPEEPAANEEEASEPEEAPEQTLADEEESSEEAPAKEESSGDGKKKFTFNCNKCGKCCEDRGPVPVVIDDLIMWAKGKVIADMMPYLKFIRTQQGTLDLVFMRDAFGKDETSDPSCPIYNKETKLCTSYDYRPMSCRTYPLEFDGAHFAVVDDECEGLDNGEMSADDRKNMKDLATRMNVQLTQMRIMMPVIAQVMQGFIIQEMIAQQQAAMEKMSPDQRKKFDEAMAKSAEAFPESEEEPSETDSE